MSAADWKWYGHPGHFILGDKCRFHLATVVGPFMISTVGELWNERVVREIHARIHDPAWLTENQDLRGDTFDAAYFERFGYERLGAYFGNDSFDDDPIYETMVFRTSGEVCNFPTCDCGMPKHEGDTLDMMRYATAGKATAGHYELCRKFDKVASKEKKDERQPDPHSLRSGSLGIDEHDS